jgi:hypothetical protein
MNLPRIILKIGIRALAVAATLCWSGCEPAENSILEEVSDRRYTVDSIAPTISVTNRDGSISIYGAGGDVREV